MYVIAPQAAAVNLIERKLKIKTLRLLDELSRIVMTILLSNGIISLAVCSDKVRPSEMGLAFFRADYERLPSEILIFGDDKHAQRS